MDQMPGRVTDMAEIESSNIWIAAGEGRLDLVEYFITHHSVNVNTKDEFSYSPLHAAVSYSQSSVVAFLIQSGADVNIQDGDGDGPLHVCEDVSVSVSSHHTQLHMLRCEAWVDCPATS